MIDVFAIPEEKALPFTTATCKDKLIAGLIKIRLLTKYKHKSIVRFCSSLVDNRSV